MNRVIYVSRGGNTKKLAEAVAKGAGVSAVPVDEVEAVENTDILFVGASIYAGKIDAKMRDFLHKLSAADVKKIVVFGTAAGKVTTLPEIKTIAGGNGIAVSDSEFHCKGSFLFVHRGHPDADDLKAAEAFARGVCKDKQNG